MLSDPKAHSRGVAGQLDSSATAPPHEGIARTDFEPAAVVSDTDLPNVKKPSMNPLWRNRQLWLVVIPTVLTCIAALVQLVGFLLSL
jgi:hypothetical protein